MDSEPEKLRLTSGPGRWVIGAAVLGSGIVFLDSTVVNVALPKIGEELPAKFLGVLEGQSYVYYGYLLTLSALLILAGGLADFHGRRRLFLIGVAGFGATSLLCGLAPNLELLVLFRILQGAAGAILVPGSLAVITASFAGEDQGKAFGFWAGGSGATTILGPALGGFLVAYVSWRAAFFINLPLVVLAFYAAARHMPESRDEQATGRFDWAGAAVVAIAIGGLTFGAIRGQQAQWHDTVAFISLALGAIATIAFPIMMARSSHPLVPLSLFRSRNFSVTNISTLVIYGALYVTFQYLALFAIGTVGYSELAFGLAGIPGSLFLVFLSSRVGTLAVRLGPRWFMTIGPAIMGISLLWLTRFPSDSAPWVADIHHLSSFVPPADYMRDLFPFQMVFGIGLSIMVTPLTTALMRSIPPHNAGIGSAINNAISRVGPQLVGAALFIAISSSFYANFEHIAGPAVVSHLNVRNDVSPLNRPDEKLGEGVTRAANLASLDAFHLAMLVSAGLCLAGAAVNAAGIRNNELRREDPAPEPAAQPA
ncbi:MAG TPA: MFS transporter [Actinomycetota bacterium]|nr:MFS transporter [Actinomycetota bacterium]